MIHDLSGHTLPYLPLLVDSYAKGVDAMIFVL